MEKKEKTPPKTLPESAISNEQAHADKLKNRRRRGKGKIPPKQYKVIVIYSPLTEEEARIKRAIIEGIIKKGYLK